MEREARDVDKAWLTEGELLQKYKRQATVDAIISEKKQIEGQHWAHPDATHARTIHQHTTQHNTT